MGESRTAAYLDGVTLTGHQSTTRDSSPWPASYAVMTLHGAARQGKAWNAAAAQLAPRVLRRQDMGVLISEGEAGSSQARIRLPEHNRVKPDLPRAIERHERHIPHGAQ
jgi:hypothetical protein